MTDQVAETHRCDVQDVGYEIRVERRGLVCRRGRCWGAPIALVDWEDGETLVAVADGASGLVRPEPPVPVEQLIFRGVSAV